MIKFLKKHYHWIIAAVLFLMMGARGGIGNNLVGLHLIPVTEALSITRAQFSLAGSACFVVSMLGTMFSGPLVQRFGCRTLLTMVLFSGAGALVIMGYADRYWLFLLGYILLGVNNGICSDVLATRVVSAWFHKHRGTVLGVVSSATGLGGSVICIVQAALISQFSYAASFYFGAVLFAVCGVLVFLFIRSHPVKMGLLPYGDGEQIAYQKREHEDHWQGFEMKQLVRRPAFYMMILGTLITCTLPYLAFNVVVPHFQDRGLSVAEASLAQSILLLCLSAVKVLAGFLCDAIGARKVAILCMVFNAIGLTLLATVSGFIPSLIAIVVYSMGLPCLTVVIPLLAGSLFGYREQNRYIGIILSMVSAASIIATPISNAFYDAYGTYSPVFLVGAAVALLMVGAYILMYRLADRDRKQLEIKE